MKEDVNEEHVNSLSLSGLGFPFSWSVSSMASKIKSFGIPNAFSTNFMDLIGTVILS